MSNPVPYTFPAPIGGVPLDLDFAPSILFAVLYGLLSQLALYRLIQPSSRTFTTFASLAFVIERVIIFALRAKQAHDPAERSSVSFTQYWQISFAIGYLSIYGDLASILRSLLSNAAHKTDVDSSSILVQEKDVVVLTLVPENIPRKGTRAGTCLKQLLAILPFTAWAAIIMGTVSGLGYPKVETDMDAIQTVQSLRYATNGIAFALLLALQIHATWAYLYVRRINRGGAFFVAFVSALLNVISIYRFVVMGFKTTSITALGPHSLNGPGSKATFYVFHIAPDIVATALIFGMNVRKTFGVGVHRHGNQIAKLRKIFNGTK